jgi:hypothetical protein
MNFKTSIAMSEIKNADYIPFGEEWKKEVSKLPKAMLIEQWVAACQKRQELESRLSQLSAPNTGKPDEDVYDISDIDTIREMYLKAKQSSKEWCDKAMEGANQRRELQSQIETLSANTGKGGVWIKDGLKSKEGILQGYDKYGFLNDSMDRDTIMQAMEDYAKIMCTAFGEWLKESNWGEKETWGKHDPPSIPTMEELYKVFQL